MGYRNRIWLYFALFAALVASLAVFCKTFGCVEFFSSKGPLIVSLENYKDASINDVWEKLRFRIHEQPFNIVSGILFLCAIVHTFMAHHFTAWSHSIRRRNSENERSSDHSFAVELLKFMGEIEVVFGLWAIPLFFSLIHFFNWKTAIHYLDDLNYLEPMFVVVIMAVASTAPIIDLAERGLKLFAKIGGETASSWWWAILTIGPLSGSLITEPGAMTISAFLLAKQFYVRKPRPVFAYATLGLLFTNISVGGVLTNFAAPPVLMVSKAWGWGTREMLFNFGWKAVIGILLSNGVYYLFFRKDLKLLNEVQHSDLKQPENKLSPKKIPAWVTLINLFFLVWIVVHNHYPPIFIGSFLLFLGFCKTTSFYQSRVELKPAILVGFFLAGLVIHGSLQAWWIEPILEKAGHMTLFVASIVLTSFNDNAEITFLATLMPNLTESMKYVVVAGAVTGGGLTVIANAPNPSGQAILGKYFKSGIAASSLFFAAIIPTLIMALCFICCIF